ncbi:MAG: hypothetical protein RL073_868 [Actinomycetota bacterium]
MYKPLPDVPMRKPADTRSPARTCALSKRPWVTNTPFVLRTTTYNVPATDPTNVTSPLAAECTGARGGVAYSIPRLPAHHVHVGGRNESVTANCVGNTSAHSAATNSINFGGTKS